MSANEQELLDRFAEVVMRDLIGRLPQPDTRAGLPAWQLAQPGLREQLAGLAYMMASDMLKARQPFIQ